MKTVRTIVVGGSVAVLALAANAASPIWTGDAATAATAPTCQGVRATIVGTRHGDNITGTEHRDVIVALGGNDVIHGRGGNDLICGGDGGDKLYGGHGDDRLFGQRDGIGFDRGGTFKLGDLVDGGVGDDYLDVGTDIRPTDQGGSPGTVSYRTATQGVHVRLATGRAFGVGADRIHVVPEMVLAGSPYADSIYGTSGSDWLSGGPGNDTIYGLGGADVLEPEAQNLVGAADDDTVYGGPGPDDIIGWKGHDVIHGGPGNDQVGSYSSQPSQVYGDDGNDWTMTAITHTSGYRLDGGAGVDVGNLIKPGANPTFPPGDPGATISVRMATGVLTRAGAVTGHLAGLESMSLAENLRWVYFGTAGRDEVSGGYYFPFRAFTYGGNDSITGTGEDDYLDAGAGADTVDGQEGHDTCVNAETRSSCEVVSP